MTEVAASERWPEQPGTIAYFCDACPDTWTERDLLERAERWADDDLTRILPLARGEDGRFRRELLFAGRGEDSLRAQYFRVNLDPADRYVLSLPGTTKHRLRADQSGFENLYLAGDWTRTRINGGSVEAAIESGEEAARAICKKHGVA